jgi:sialate O-acetylesterase
MARGLCASSNALLALLALCAAAADAAISLPTHFASSMVWPRDAPVAFWGLDTPGSRINVTFRGAAQPQATADTAGRWQVLVPAAAASTAPGTVVVTSSSGAAAVTLEDVVVGDLFVCSGQSNMEITVAWTAYYADALARAAALGPVLRLLQVALVDSYVNATTPQTNFTANLPWSRAAAASASGFSAACYYFGAEVVNAHPDVPVGLVANAWGGVPIEVWMSPVAYAECKAAPGLDDDEQHLSPAARRGAAAAAAADRAALAAARGRDAPTATPVAPSCLYNAMMAPLLSIPIAGILWYQGEANLNLPLRYNCSQRAMVRDWRRSWAAVRAPEAPVVPFLFMQLACWPVAYPSDPLLPAFRYMQQQLTSEPRTGMVVTADLCDPAGAYHPIHPPFKAEVGRRAFQWFDNELYGNASSARAGPAVTSITWDSWEQSWGDFHWGTGANSYVCGGSSFACGGLRVTFDRPVAIRDFFKPSAEGQVTRVYGFNTGAASGFFASASDAADPAGTAYMQPIVLSGVSADGLTVQLNVTWIGVKPRTPLGGTLFYAFGDYPQAMPLVDAWSGLPVAPFNMSVPPSPARPANGTCTSFPDTDGASGGVISPSGSLDCCAACWADPQCVSAAFATSAPGTCFLKYGSGTVAKPGTTLCVLDL